MDGSFGFLRIVVTSRAQSLACVRDRSRRVWICLAILPVEIRQLWQPVQQGAKVRNPPGAWEMVACMPVGQLRRARILAVPVIS